MESSVETSREFSRTWVEVQSLLERSLLEVGFTLAEARVLLEIGQCAPVIREELSNRMSLDSDSLSQALRNLEQRDALVSSSPNAGKAPSVLALTGAGREMYDDLDQRLSDLFHDHLASLTGEQQATLIESAATISRLLIPDRQERNVVIRELRPGDLGWVVSRNGAIYADQFGWDTSFEALVARVLSDYRASFRPGREDGWIAEVNSARAGCVFCVERDAVTAQLRVLLVEPWARGAGLGSRLVDECVAFARRAGYSKMMLWTVDTLVSARRIYKGAGFALVHEEPQEQFGYQMIDEIWELDLTGGEIAAADR